MGTCELADAVMQVAEKLSSMGPIALQVAKTAISYGAQADLRTGLALQARCYSHCFGTENRVKGGKYLPGEKEAPIQRKAKMYQEPLQVTTMNLHGDSKKHRHNGG